MNHRTIPAALAAAAIALVTLTACKSTASSAGTGAAASASSALANPTVSSDLNATEQQLLANLKANFSAVHPVKSVEAAVRATFPQGDTTRIVNYAVKTFTLAVVHTSGPGSARDTWAQGVVTYAQAQGAQPAASPSAPTVATS